MSETSDTEEILNALERHIRPSLREGLWRYLKHHIPTGSFLRACLENDFREAMLRVDYALSAEDIRYVALLIASFPPESHGSRQAVADWIAKGQSETPKNNPNVENAQAAPVASSPVLP
jgi:hypothetical protein